MVRRASVSVLLVALLGSAAAAQELTPAMRAAAARAGDRRAEFEAGFEGLDAGGRAAYAFLLRHMPARDLDALQPSLLRENVLLANEARAAAMAKETPQEKAAREREEMAARGARF